MFPESIGGDGEQNIIVCNLGTQAGPLTVRGRAEHPALAGRDESKARAYNFDHSVVPMDRAAAPAVVMAVNAVVSTLASATQAPI